MTGGLKSTVGGLSGIDPEKTGRSYMEQANSITSQSYDMLRSMLDAIPSPAMVIDDGRRLVLANARLIDTFGLSSEDIGGKRPGDAFNCSFSMESPNGCGAGLHCTVCGAMRSIIACQETGGSATAHCQIMIGLGDDRSLDMEVNSTSAVIDGIPLTVCVLRDVSEENRRKSLERIFYHDVLNIAGGIHGLAELLNNHAVGEPEQEQQYKQWMVDLSRRLTEEILHQQKFVSAERGDFTPDLGLVSLDELLGDIQALYASHSVADGRKLLLGGLCGSHILSDASILRRIVGNLVKNALEATPRDGAVTISCTATDADVTVAVHNPGLIPPEVQLQIFRRSFSTKGESGRGLGCYSAKIFGERYLKGKVGFTSTDENGTTFFLTLPKPGKLT